MSLLKGKTKKAYKIVAATFTAVFSLAAAFVGTYAWFMSSTNVEVTGQTFRVVTPSVKIDTLNLVKFDYSYNVIDGEIMYNYLNPENGNVNEYTYDETRDSYVRIEDGNYIETDIMNRYDPVDGIIHNDSLREMNCNSIYKVTLTSTEYTDCYMHLDAIFHEETPSANQLCLSDCVDFEVFYPSDLANNNILFWNKESSNYTAYYPDYEFDTDEEEYLYYKISYLSDLRNSHLTAEDLVEMEILEPEDIEGLTEEQKEELTRNTLGPRSKNLYSNNPKTNVSVVRNKAVTFTGSPEKSITVYINVNYSPSQLEQYLTDIYTRSYVAIDDLYFSFNFTQQESR